VPRPLPYTPAFATAFPTIITFVGTLEGTVTSEAGEQFRLLVTDLAHEVMTPTSFSSTAPIHAFLVDAEGRIRDRASLVGRVNIDRTTGEAVHQIVDSGTCHGRSSHRFPKARSTTGVPEPREGGTRTAALDSTRESASPACAASQNARVLSRAERNDEGLVGI